MYLINEYFIYNVYNVFKMHHTPFATNIILVLHEYVLHRKHKLHSKYKCAVQLIRCKQIHPQDMHMRYASDILASPTPLQWSQLAPMTDLDPRPVFCTAVFTSFTKITTSSICLFSFHSLMVI